VSKLKDWLGITERKRQRRREEFTHALQQRASQQLPLQLVIGAAGVGQAGWLSTDIELLNLLLPETWAEHLSDDSVDALLAEHVWEHLTPEQGVTAARTCFRFLRPGGHLRVAVPDGCHPDASYITMVEPGGTGDGADDHKVLYTHETFQATFEQAGFEVRLLEYFDAGGEFHRADWSPKEGFIHRSAENDRRNQEGKLVYTSLILDAVKPG